MFLNLIKTGLRTPFAAPLLIANNLVAQQVRTTFILKRRSKVPLYKKNQRATKLRGRHFNYDLIEDTNTKKHPNVDVILTEYVSGIGRKGEIVNISPTYAYNKLLLPGIAVYVTEQNIEKYVKTAADLPDAEKHSSQFAQRTVSILQKRTFDIIMNKDQPWELEAWHIRASLRKAGVHILHDTSIELPKQKIHGPDLTKESKAFYVTVTVNKTEKARVRCKLHHWSTNPVDKLPWVFKHWEQSAELLFPDDPDQQDSNIEDKIEA